jgi:hypothetical protein
VTYRLKARSGEPEEMCVARLWHGKHTLAAMNNQTTIQELLEACFLWNAYMWKWIQIFPA